MYHRILIPMIDQHVHRYLWRDLDVDREPDVYVNQVLLFGDKPAGTMAITTLRLTADESRKEYPRAAEVIEANTYMDDMCPYVKSEAETTLTQEVDRLLGLGVILRDSHGFAQVRWVTGNKILRVLKTKGLSHNIPDDLYHMIKRGVAARKHLERNRKDRDAKFRLILESRIHRLARYYKRKRVLPPNWKYESDTASAMVA
ncbi:PREDICTED: 40S ribosomal protein S13-like isoform X2 [Priapulus caudatus]|uniref:40S ribosomal protein S13-like isoform X2 n=1 Tax=Priapulus caudatus TaxID=37621 RepID=A0ABM1E485_PRICU|nr:PREDICTED: 40S ribosomal protein S13-like isoform X2 [Priapulus caudatus]